MTVSLPQVVASALSLGLSSHASGERPGRVRRKRSTQRVITSFSWPLLPVLCPLNENASSEHTIFGCAGNWH